MIPYELIRENNRKLKGWKFQAWGAFVKLNEIRPDIHVLGKEKIPQLAHNFYDYIFRVREMDMLDENESKGVRYIEKSVHLKRDKGITDHPFSARGGFRAIMFEHQYLLNDFETFAKSFFILATSVLRVTEDTNQRVKLKKDGYGDLIVPKIITERYVNKDGSPITFYDTLTKNYIHEFPLSIPPWYLEYESKRVPANLSNFL